MRRRSLLLLLFFATAAHGLQRDPAVSRTHVAFVHDGQVWIVPRGGGAATRLTDTAGNKFDPRFSPDGQRIAFSANENRGLVNIYTVSIRGGAPSRVTWLPSHQNLSQWTADDRLVFHTNSLSFSRIEMQLYTVSPHGEMPRQLPPAYGSYGAIDDRGEWLAYTPKWPNPLVDRWKRYRGGTAADIALLNLRTGESSTITDWAGPDLRPMWQGSTIYYLSDAGFGRRFDLWSYDILTRARRQVTDFRDLDVRNPSIGAGAIVFQHGADLRLLDLAKGTTAKVRVALPAKTLHRDVDASKFITNRQLAGGQALFEARGDLWIGPAGGKPHNLTATSGVFEREAALSPDGSTLAYSSDVTGEYQLYLRAIEGAPVQLTRSTSGFRYRPAWSPDSKRLAFADHTGAIFVCDVAALRVEQIDKEPWGESVEMAWSADSSWLSYTRTNDHRVATLWRYDVATGTRTQITADAFNAGTPAFDAAGGHLFFISYRNFATPVVDWIQQRVAHRATAVIMAVPLPAAGEDFERNAVRLPTTAGSITALATTKSGDPIFGLVDGAGKSSVRIYRMREKKEEVVLEGTTDFSLAPDGVEVKVDTSAMTVRVDLRVEWRQIFADVWRSYRDYFYAPKVAGTFDWDEVRRTYSPLVEHCVTREDLNDVIAEMIGEVSVGHAYIGSSGDVAVSPPNPTGMLGADFEVEQGAYRIARIYEGAPWDDTVRSPLRGVSAGEYLLAVNGIALDVTKDPRAAFAGLGEKAVTIRVGPSATGEGARDVVVTPLASENALRYGHWVERNRRRVDEISGGRAGYIHVPDFTTSGVNEFARQFYGQIHKDALVIDARWSLGGWTGAVLAELLDRPLLNSAASRDSDRAWPVPRRGAHFGKKALLVNHVTVSAGENFAFYFRKLGLGTIVGARTWGGLTGLNPVPALIDGGYVNVPNAPFFDESGWLIEGHGLDPDVTVDGTDDQLDAAVRAVMR